MAGEDGEALDEHAVAKELQRHGIKSRLQAREKADETWLPLDLGANQESNHVG